MSDNIVREYDIDMNDCFEELLPLKWAAEEYHENPVQDTKAKVLAQLILRAFEDNEALTLADIVNGSSTVIGLRDTFGRHWFALFTDIYEVGADGTFKFSSLLPVRDLIRYAFDFNDYEGLVVNPYTDNVVFGKDELECAVHMIQVKEGMENE